MNTEDLKKHRENLEKEAKELEGELKQFAVKDPEVKDDWDTKFPSFGDVREDQDENTSEVEDYENKMGVEHELELRLAEINLALEKIKKNAYGFCEKCGVAIEKDRLEINPEARYCEKHME